MNGYTPRSSDGSSLVSLISVMKDVLTPSDDGTPEIRNNSPAGLNVPLNTGCGRSSLPVVKIVPSDLWNVLYGFISYAL